jgi:cell wall-associated NlpC family hydrolase
MFGENFSVYEEANGWAWGQIGDGYVGYVPAQCLSIPRDVPTHRIVATHSFLFASPDLKLAPTGPLPMNAKLSIAANDGRFARLTSGEYVPAAHIAPLDLRATDFVAIAESFLGVPYLWGGKTVFGCDCSGLIQTALERCGVSVPRDTDMQEKMLGRTISADLSALQRGDIVFWDGHMGVMRDGTHLLHANGHHACVASEPLADAITRIAASGFAITSVRRL